MRALRNPFGSLPPEVAVLTAVAFSVALGFGIVAPAIPLFAKDFGVSNFAAGAVISVFALVRFASAPMAGRFVNRFGERLVLATGIGIVGVSSLLAGFSGNYTQLLVLRGIGGLGSAMFTVSSFALLLRVVAPDQRGRAAGTYQTGFLLGAIAGPAFGGPLTAWSLRAPFFVYATTLLVAGTLATVFLARTALREHEVIAGTADHAPTPLGTALRSSAYRAAVANNFAVGWAIFGVRSSLIPLFVVEGLRLGPSWTGAGLVLSAAVQGLVLIPAGRLVDTRGRRPFLRAGAAFSLVAGVAMAFAGGAPLFLAGMALYGTGSALLGVSSAAVVGDVIGGRGGTPVAAFQMASDAGAFLGPLVAGALADTASFEVAFLATAAVSGLAFVSTLVMPETQRDPLTTDP
ncbi:MAG TPA: MFS transporter [Dermatophilaceae bacterium]|jgi:DHA1 family multidrug resistance protein-like MFS transporter|nr:MFS transporter [Dermatophilaceae bacterium]